MIVRLKQVGKDFLSKSRLAMPNAPLDPDVYNLFDSLDDGMRTE